MASIASLAATQFLKSSSNKGGWTLVLAAPRFLTPVVVVPGLGGSVIWNKRDLSSVGPSQSFLSKLVDVYGALHSAADADCRRCQMEHSGLIKPGVDADAWKSVAPADERGRLVLSDYFGGVDSLDVLLRIEDHPLPVYTEYVFHHLFGDLRQAGYVPSESVFGAPYDFRIVSSLQCQERYFLTLRLLLENAVAQNGGRPALLLAHSLGAIITKRFLVEYLSAELGAAGAQTWRDAHVKMWVPVGGPFGGAPMAFRTCISSDDWYQLIACDLGGPMGMLPERELWRGTSWVPEEGLTRDAGAPDVAGSAVRAYDPPLVHCEFIVGVAVSTKVAYHHGEQLDRNPTVAFESPDFYAALPPSALRNEILAGEDHLVGDDTVPWLSLHVPKVWLNDTVKDLASKYRGVSGSRPNCRYMTSIKEFTGPQYCHEDMLNEPDVRAYILHLLELQPPPP